MAKEEHHVPTPPLGWPVYYIRNPGKDEQTMAGWCVNVEDVGKISIFYILPNGHTQFQRGVHHRSDPDMDIRGPRSRAGAWRLQDNVPSPRGLLDLSKERERKRAEAIAKATQSQAAVERQVKGMKALSDEKEPQGV